MGNQEQATHGLGRVLCLIPARGGSKRIPNKNTKVFGGKAILQYSIDAAFDCGLFDEIVVSTDSPQIAKVAEELGASTPFVRPDEAASDTATTAEVIAHALDWFEAIGQKWNIVCCLYPTAPFCRPESLIAGYRLLVDREVPAVLPVTEFAYPIQRSLKVKDDGSVVMNWPEYEVTRSQDLPHAYHDAGQFYWLQVKSFRDNPCLMPAGTLPLFLPRHEVVDIDTPEDWDFAERLFKSNQQ